MSASGEPSPRLLARLADKEIISRACYLAKKGSEKNCPRHRAHPGTTPQLLDREDDGLPAADQRFIGDVTAGMQAREIPEHIKQTILTLIASSPEKKP